MIQFVNLCKILYQYCLLALSAYRTVMILRLQHLLNNIIVTLLFGQLCTTTPFVASPLRNFDYLSRGCGVCVGWLEGGDAWTVVRGRGDGKKEGYGGWREAGREGGRKEGRERKINSSAAKLCATSNL